MARKREKKTYNYECTLTGEKFRTTREAPNPEDLISVAGYYQLNSDKDDRPLKIKLKIENEKASNPVIENPEDPTPKD